MVINIETNVVYALLSTIVAITLIVFVYKMLYLSKVFKYGIKDNDPTEEDVGAWPGEKP